jgi:hypothetical protein
MNLPRSVSGPIEKKKEFVFSKPIVRGIEQGIAHRELSYALKMI